MKRCPAQKVWTDKALMALPHDGRKYELVAGALVVSPTGFEHGIVSVRLSGPLLQHVLSRRLGAVADSSTGFRMKNGDVLSPDVSFVRKERLGREITSKFFEGAPDLAVEVLSPDDRIAAVRKKLAAYFANGTRLAWVINPKERTATVYRSSEQGAAVHADGLLEGEDVVPGFSFPVAKLFAEPEPGS
jgi:Uma2 family endonuclease